MRQIKKKKINAVTVLSCVTVQFVIVPGQMGPIQNAFGHMGSEQMGSRQIDPGQFCLRTQNVTVLV